MIEILQDLEFIKPAQKRKGNARDTHCRIANGWLEAYCNGISIGVYNHNRYKLNVCMNTHITIDALKHCKKLKQDISLTMLDSGNMQLLSGDLDITIPCVEIDVLPEMEPDNNLYQLSREADLTKGFKLFTKLGEDCLLKSGSVVIYKNTILAEYWHGASFPEILIPANAVKILGRIKKDIVGFGLSGEYPNIRTITFWFEDGSYLKTDVNNIDGTEYHKLRDDKYLKIFEGFENINPQPISKDLFSALEAVKKVSKNGVVKFNSNGIEYSTGEKVASYGATEIETDQPFHIETLLGMKDLANTICFNDEIGRALFYENKVRGIIRNYGE